MFLVCLGTVFTNMKNAGIRLSSSSTRHSQQYTSHSNIAAREAAILGHAHNSSLSIHFPRCLDSPSTLIRFLKGLPQRLSDLFKTLLSFNFAPLPLFLYTPANLSQVQLTNLESDIEVSIRGAYLIHTVPVSTYRRKDPVAGKKTCIPTFNSVPVIG